MHQTEAAKILTSDKSPIMSNSESISTSNKKYLQNRINSSSVSRSPSPASSIASTILNQNLSQTNNSSKSSDENHSFLPTGKSSEGFSLVPNNLLKQISSNTSPSIVPSPASSFQMPNPPMPLPPIACEAKQLNKLKRFLTTIQQFANDVSIETGDRVRHLVLNVVNLNISIEDFHARLHEATNFPLRPFVIPFLKASLPLLQRELSYLARLEKSNINEYLAQDMEKSYYRNMDHLNLSISSHISQIPMVKSPGFGKNNQNFHLSHLNENGKRKSPESSDDLQPHKKSTMFRSSCLSGKTNVSPNKILYPPSVPNHQQTPLAPSMNLQPNHMILQSVQPNIPLPSPIMPAINNINFNTAHFNLEDMNLLRDLKGGEIIQ